MEEYMCGDIWTWLQDTDRRIFRYWVYKRMFTPDEMEKKYIDQGVYEDSYCKFGIITECVELPSKDLLIGFQDVYGDDISAELSGTISYYRLSEIRMEYHAADQDMLLDYEDRQDDE